MRKRQPGKPGADDASAYSRRAAVADSLWSAQDRLRSTLSAAPRAVAEAVGRPFERVSYGVRKRLLWPLEDRAETAGAPARALGMAVVILVAAGAGVAGLLWAAPNQPNSTATQVAMTSSPSPPPAEASPKPAAEPTLQGAAPVFKPAGAQASEVDPAKAIAKASPAEQGGGSTAAKADEGSASASTSAVDQPAVDGPPAGPAAISVARDFAGAFVLYETGNSDSGVRQTLGETATPALAKALLRRPPRLPANVEVPKAKVLNVVPGPSHGDVYPVSVSLLRVGLTSELRLEMEQRKGDRWQVTNVLG